jgi:hypothetical protein
VETEVVRGWNAALAAIELSIGHQQLWKSEGSNTPNLIHLAAIQKAIKELREHPPSRRR